MDLSTCDPEDKRTKTVKELYQSELLYITNLRNMVSVCFAQKLHIICLLSFYIKRDLLNHYGKEN